MPSEARTRRTRSSPEPSGSRRSTTARSGRRDSSSPSACSIVPATISSKPSAVRLSAKNVRITGSSSTIRMESAIARVGGARPKNFALARRRAEARRSDARGREANRGRLGDLAARQHAALAPADHGGPAHRGADLVGGDEAAGQPPLELALASAHVADVADRRRAGRPRSARRARGPSGARAPPRPTPPPAPPVQRPSKPMRTVSLELSAAPVSMIMPCSRGNWMSPRSTAPARGSTSCAAAGAAPTSSTRGANATAERMVIGRT